MHPGINATATTAASPPCSTISRTQSRTTVTTAPAAPSPSLSIGSMCWVPHQLLTSSAFPPRAGSCACATAFLTSLS